MKHLSNEEGTKIMFATLIVVLTLLNFMLLFKIIA